MSALSTPKLHLVHLGTNVVLPCPTGHSHAGETWWGSRASPSFIARVSWQWVELTRGVFAMLNPLELSTNLQLVGPRGETLTDLETALHLNELVRTLPWQTEVARALEVEHTPYATPH